MAKELCQKSIENRINAYSELVKNGLKLVEYWYNVYCKSWLNLR